MTTFDEMMEDSEPEPEDLITRLQRIRTQLCPNMKYADEVERCPCQRGGHDAGLGQGHQTGCKDIRDAIDKLNKDDG